MSWTLTGLLRAAGIDAECHGDGEVRGLSHDHRTVTRGDLFCCIVGERTDGHAHAADAAGRGAAALLVERFVDVDLPQARVAAMRPSLGPVADAFFDHPSRRMRCAAVTGTNGKTTTTYLLESIAIAAGLEPGVIGSISRRFADVVEEAPRTTPEAIDLQRVLARMAEAATSFVALEATSDGLAQHRLDGTTFAVAGFTNLTQDHLNTHGSMDAYFAAKSLLFRMAPRAVINADDAYGRRLADAIGGSVEVVTYGSGDIVASDVELGATGTTATFHTPAGPIDVRMGLVGRYNVSNAMCATGMALACGIEPDHIAAGLASIDAMPGRLERVVAGQPFLALVDYAHTPDALEQALTACRELATGRVIVVFGCGGDRDRAKRPKMGEAATRLADLSVITSDNPRTEDPDRILADIAEGARAGGHPFRSIVDRREAIAVALHEATTGDVVLVAGKGHEQGQTFADRTVPFDDRVVVKDLLSEDPACAR